MCAYQHAADQLCTHSCVGVKVCQYLADLLPKRLSIVPLVPPRSSTALPLPTSPKDLSRHILVRLSARGIYVHYVTALIDGLADGLTGGSNDGKESSHCLSARLMKDDNP